AVIAAASGQVGRVAERGAARVELRYEGVVVAAVVGGVEGAGGGREVRRGRAPRDVGVACAVEREAVAVVAAASAQKAGIEEGGAARVKLRHERVITAVVGRVEGASGRREVRGTRAPGEVGAAGSINREGVALVAAASASAQVGGVAEGGPARVDLRHEGVERAAKGRVEGAG